MADCAPAYAFCFIDGARNWTIGGFAFSLDKLRRDGGWILVDDFDWTHAATGRRATDGVNHQGLGKDELTTPHIERLVRLLVAQHPDGGEIRIQDGAGAWARAIRRDGRTLSIDETSLYKALGRRGLRGALMRSAGVSSVGCEPGRPGPGWIRRPHHPGDHGSGRAFAPGPRDRIRVAGRRGSP